MQRICFKCDKEVSSKEPYKMVALEVPYYNAFFHMECYLNCMREFDDIYLYISSEDSLKKLNEILTKKSK